MTSVADAVNPKINKLLIEETERREQVYNITKVGKGTSIEKIPDELRTGKVPFGLSTLSGERADIAFKHTDFATHDSARERYKKSHKSYAPGEQVKRDYDWNLDPASTTFGKSIERESEGVSGAMTWKANQPKNPRKSPNFDADMSLPPLQDMTFGVKTEKFDNASEILKAWPTPIEKSTSPKQHARPDGTPFGRVESVSPTTSPVASKTRGIYEEDWLKSRNKEELWDIIQGAKVRASRELFEEAYAKAVEKFKVPSVENVWKMLAEIQLKQFM